jgi:hypothetical protein
MPTQAQLNANRLNAQKSTGPTQLSLVDTLISTEWIQRRLRRVEAQLWNYRVECLDQNLTHAEFVDASIQHNSPLGHSYQEAFDPFARLQRRIDATNRMYLRTLKVLQDLQAAASTPVSEPPSPVPTHLLTPPIGFVPQSVPESRTAHARHGNLCLLVQQFALALMESTSLLPFAFCLLPFAFCLLP